VQHELFAALALFAVAAVNVHLLPAGQQLGLALGQPRLHREIGLRQKDGRLV